VTIGNVGRIILPTPGRIYEQNSGPCKTASKLSESIHRRLDMYAIAASAAGVGVLALVLPSEAKIVYTRANQTLGFGVTMLDLNNDGTPDFGSCINSNSDSGSCPLARGREFVGKHRPGPFEQLFIFPAAGKSKQNRIWGNASGAYALAAGVVLGGKVNFTPGSKGMAGCFAATTSSCGGAWYNASHRYLALKFVVSGAIHYGWARLTVKGCCSAMLTGYAYETIPNKSILTGDIAGPLKRNSVSQKGPQPGGVRGVRTTNRATASLGVLATGAEGLMAWLRKDRDE